MLGSLVQVVFVFLFVHTSLAMPAYFPRQSQLISASMDCDGLIERGVPMRDIYRRSPKQGTSPAVSISATACATEMKEMGNENAAKGKGKRKGERNWTVA